MTELADIQRDTEIALSRLTPREQLILRLRFGIGFPEDHSQTEIAQHLGFSEKTIRNIESSALRKLRQTPDINGGAESAVPAAPIKEEIYNFQSALYPALQTKEVIEGVQRLTPGLIEYLKCHSDKLEMIPWDVFEHLVAEFLAEKGFEDVRLVGRDQQTSADIYAAKSIPLFEKGFRLFVEVKKWKNRIGIEVINEVLGAFISEQQLYGWNAAIVIAKGGFRTLRKFRPPEIALMNVELKQKDDLLQWLEGYQSNKGGLWLPYPKRKMPQS